MNDLLNHLTKIVEDNDERFSFEWSASSGIMEIYDKQESTGYLVKLEKIYERKEDM